MGARLMLKRVSGWENILAEFITSKQKTRFKRGQHDCALFACSCVLKITGVDPAKWFRGRYASKKGAAEALKQYGGTLEVVADKILGDELKCPVIPPLMAQRGDIVLVKKNGGTALGIVDFDGEIILADQGQKVGLAKVPFTWASKAWKVG